MYFDVFAHKNSLAIKIVNNAIQRKNQVSDNFIKLKLYPADKRDPAMYYVGKRKIPDLSDILYELIEPSCICCLLDLCDSLQTQNV